MCAQGGFLSSNSLRQEVLSVRPCLCIGIKTKVLGLLILATLYNPIPSQWQHQFCHLPPSFLVPRVFPSFGELIHLKENFIQHFLIFIAFKLHHFTLTALEVVSVSFYEKRELDS